jgi:hypothetical protein
MSHPNNNWELFAEVVSKLPGRTIWVDHVSFDVPIYNGSQNEDPPRATGGYPSLESYLKLIGLSERDIEPVGVPKTGGELGPSP